jgi:hypothetical protein
MRLYLIALSAFTGKAHYQRRYHIAKSGRETYCGRPSDPPLETEPYPGTAH